MTHVRSSAVWLPTQVVEDSINGGQRGADDQFFTIPCAEQVAVVVHGGELRVYPLVMTNIAMENPLSMEVYSWENHL